MTPEKPKGPASYFPSIEKKYGQPMAHWFDLLKSCEGLKHMEMVSWLKTEHGMGHGHANAIVAPSYRFYPNETTEASQVASAMRTYGVAAPISPRNE